MRAQSQADQPVLTIPLRCMLSTATALQSKMKRFATEDKMLSRMPNVLLSVHLLSELRNGQS